MTRFDRALTARPKLGAGNRFNGAVWNQLEMEGPNPERGDGAGTDAGSRRLEGTKEATRPMTSTTKRYLVEIGYPVLGAVFWLLYIMFVMVSASGLIATAQIAPIASDFGVANTLVLLGGSPLTVALIVDNVANGATRPLFGWISDNIGREYTMTIAFSLGGIAYWLLFRPAPIHSGRNS